MATGGMVEYLYSLSMTMPDYDRVNDGDAGPLNKLHSQGTLRSGTLSLR